MKYFKTILILVIPLLLIAVYAVLPIDLGIEKADLSSMPYVAEIKRIFDNEKELAKEHTAQKPIQGKSKATKPICKEISLDTTNHRILFFGDSMLEGLGPRMCDYAMENGHELFTVCWYSSSTETWAKTDTLEHFVAQFKPDYIMICIGSNEQFKKDLDDRRQYIRTIRQKLNGIPTIWICPPEWKKDRPFNNVLLEEVGEKNFFDSRKLTYERKSDHAHPTRESASIWMDSIATWMQSTANKQPIKMAKPINKRKRTWKSVYLAPPV